MSPRVREDSVHPRLQSGGCVRPLNSTVRCRVLSRPGCLVLCAVLVAGCVTSKPMELCDPNAKPDIPQIVMKKALSGAQAYSDHVYGRDCVVCAEVFAETPATFKLHITSPSSPDMLLNTSAEVTVNSSDGSVISSGRYHSCYVHRSHGGGT